MIPAAPQCLSLDEHFRGGQRYQVPGPGDRFSLQVTSPYGHKHTVVYASEIFAGDIPMAPLAAGLHEYRGSNDDLAFRVRSIQPVERPGGGMTSESTRFYEASWLVETGP